jgi:hypothetical protein
LSESSLRRIAFACPITIFAADPSTAKYLLRVTTSSWDKTMLISKVEIQFFSWKKKFSVAPPAFQF